MSAYICLVWNVCDYYVEDSYIALLFRPLLMYLFYVRIIIIISYVVFSLV